jgi:hypothetical protein
MFMRVWALILAASADFLVSHDCHPIMMKVMVPTITSNHSGLLRDVYQGGELYSGLPAKNPAKNKIMAITMQAIVMRCSTAIL